MLLDPALGTTSAVRADGDVAPLRRVLVHRPGAAALARVAADPPGWLFDGAPDPGCLAAQHDELVAALGARGAEVVTIDALAGGPALDALPNLLFPRDVLAVVGDGLVLAGMALEARRAEVEVARALARHPLLHGRRWADGDLRLEGGDVLLAGDGVVVVGVGPRTTRRAAHGLARRLLGEGGAREVVVAELPADGPFHLDLACTFAGTDLVVADRAVLDRTRALRLRPRRPPASGGPLLQAVARALGRPLRVVEAADDAHGRTWDRGANVVALDDGVVLAYADNTVTNGRLRAAGVEVLELPGTALGLGRGGPRCLTCPLVRG